MTLKVEKNAGLAYWEEHSAGIAGSGQKLFFKRRFINLIPPGFPIEK